MRFYRSCQCRSRLGLASRPGSRPLSLLGTTMVTLVLVISAPRRWPLPLEGPSSWQAFHRPCVETLLREQDQQAPHYSVQGNRPLWWYPESYWHWWLFHITQEHDCHPGQPCQGHLLWYLLDLQKPDPSLWKETMLIKSSYQEFTDHLVETHTRGSAQGTQAPALATTYESI